MPYKGCYIGDLVWLRDEPAKIVQLDKEDHMFPLLVEYESDMNREWCGIEEVTKREESDMSREIQLQLGTYDIDVAELCRQMTEGQRVHMANHLWKHYEVGAQKLLQDAEATELPHALIINKKLYELA